MLHLLLKECGQKNTGWSMGNERIFDSIMESFVPPNDLTEWITVLAQYPEMEEMPEILPGWELCSFERAMETYKVVKDMNAPESEFQNYLKRMYGDEQNHIEKYWNNFLLLTDYSDGGCGIGSMNTDFGGMIIVHEIHAPWRVGFQNMDKLIETALVCRKSGVWKSIDDIDWLLYAEIGKKLNPECEHWLQ
jgi:hypothetical protein